MTSLSLTGCESAKTGNSPEELMFTYVTVPLNEATIVLRKYTDAIRYSDCIGILLQEYCLNFK